MEPKPTPQNDPMQTNDRPISAPSQKRVIAPLEGQVESLQASVAQPSPVAPVAPVAESQPAQPDLAGASFAEQTPTPEATPISNPTPLPVFDSNPAPAVAVVVGGDSTPSQPSVSSTPGATPPQNDKPKSTKKKKALLIGVPLVVVALSLGAIFGLYIPNTPAAVWNTGVSRTGTALDKLVGSAVSADQINKLETSELTGSLDVTFGEQKFSGDITATFDKSSLNSGLNVKMNDENGKPQELAAKLLAKQAEGSDYPDVYFQLSGLNATGFSAYSSGLAGYDGKWIYASHDYIKTFADKYAGEGDKKDANFDITAADIKEVADAATQVTQDYVFSTDEQKAVLVKKSFVGKEQVDGSKMYHYKATINKDHAKDYCVAMAKAVTATNAYKSVTGKTADDITKDLKNIDKDCKVESAPKKDMDVWIGGKYRLIHKIRITEDDSKTYYEVGQNYTGGDEITMFATVTDPESKSTGRMSVATNVKNYQTTFKVTGKSDMFTLDLSLSAKSSNAKVDVLVPAGAVPLEDLLKAFESESAGSPNIVL